MEDIFAGLTEPTAEECSSNAKSTVFIGSVVVEGWACWYPQMGGYIAKCFIVPAGGCFEAFVWHDGSFPFGDGQSPARLHHCMAEQFVEFGQFVASITEPDE